MLLQSSHLSSVEKSGSIQTGGGSPVQRRTFVIPLEEGVFSIGRRRMHRNMPSGGREKNMTSGCL
jgi:hypothetical protein